MQPNSPLIVGELKTKGEEKLLSDLLHQAGILYYDCNFVASTQTLEVIQTSIEIHRPAVVLLLGDQALQKCTGKLSVHKWRSSYLKGDSQLELTYQPQMIATFDMESVNKMWAWSYLAVHDFKRVAQELHQPVQIPEYNFILNPNYSQTWAILTELLTQAEAGELQLSVDLETRARQIACVGLAWSPLDAICIPFMITTGDSNYWTLEEELSLVQGLAKLLTHRNVQIIGQNFLYDAQYLARQWGIEVLPSFDTMIGHAVLFPGLPKNLGFLSSLYCKYHYYWKDESENWKPSEGELQLWKYNCKDCVATFEIALELQQALSIANLSKPFSFEMSLLRPILHMMLRGTAINAKERGKMLMDLLQAKALCEEYFCAILPGIKLAVAKNAKPWYTSARQQQTLFYTIFKLPPIRNRKTGKPTCDDTALVEIGKKEPLLQPLCTTLATYRSLGVFLSTFIQAPLDHDKRIRCSYNPVGTETFRFNSTTDVFNYGTNLQNIPTGDF